MEFIKKTGKSLLISIVVLFVLTFLMTIFNYIGWFKYNLVNILEIIILFLAVFAGSFYSGKNTRQKGWLSGIKYGTVFLIILVIFNYLGFNIKMEFKNLIYYLILMTSSTLGSMVGINFKSDKEQ